MSSATRNVSGFGNSVLKEHQAITTVKRQLALAIIPIPESPKDGIVGLERLVSAFRASQNGPVVAGVGVSDLHFSHINYAIEKADEAAGHTVRRHGPVQAGAEFLRFGYLGGQQAHSRL